MNKIEHFLTSVVLPAAVGALLAMGVVGGGVFAVTAPPEDNPADQPVLVYGR